MLTRLFTAALLFGALEPLLAEQECSSLSALSLPHTTIVSAVNAPEGKIPSPAGFGNTASLVAPARCEVQAISRPTKDSEIRLTGEHPMFAPGADADCPPACDRTIQGRLRSVR